MADTSIILTNGVIFSTLQHTDPHTVRGRSTQRDGVCNDHIFRNRSFGELKIAKESNDLPVADLAKVLPESYQKSNEFSVNRKCGQNVATDNRTFTDKDKVRCIQTLGSEYKDAMLNCKSGFHQSEDKRKLNCHKLRSSYVTSILITKITFTMFLLKLSTLSAAFLFVSLVFSLLCAYSTLSSVPDTRSMHMLIWALQCLLSGQSTCVFTARNKI